MGRSARGAGSLRKPASFSSTGQTCRIRSRMTSPPTSLKSRHSEPPHGVRSGRSSQKAAPLAAAYVVGSDARRARPSHHKNPLAHSPKSPRQLTPSWHRPGIASHRRSIGERSTGSRSAASDEAGPWANRSKSSPKPACSVPTRPTRHQTGPFRRRAPRGLRSERRSNADLR